LTFSKTYVKLDKLIPYFGGEIMGTEAETKTDHLVDEKNAITFRLFGKETKVYPETWLYEMIEMIMKGGQECQET
jgi:hypothetical protein